jgi:hypothetical protein
MTDKTLVFKHGASAYQNRGCHCEICTSAHNELVKTYAKNTRANAKALKLEVEALRFEVAELRQWRDMMTAFVAAAPSAIGDQVAP